MRLEAWMTQFHYHAYVKQSIIQSINDLNPQNPKPKILWYF